VSLTERSNRVGGGDTAGHAVRLVAPLRLPGRLHVRGRRPAGRAAGAGTGARPRPPARPPGCRGAPRADRRPITGGDPTPRLLPDSLHQRLLPDRRLDVPRRPSRRPADRVD
jgi:hypothetical protein